MFKFKVNDQVKVTIGKDKGKVSKIEATYPQKQAVLVKGVNVYKKHLKKQSQDKPGSIIDLPKPLNVAKIALICPKCHLPTRIGFKDTGAKKHRICKKCQKPIDGGKSASRRK